MSRVVAPHPVVPRFGVAVAWADDAGVLAANPLWQALGPLADPLPPPAPRGLGGIRFWPLRFAHHRLPVWTALAGTAASRHWPRPELPDHAAATRCLLAYVPSRTPDFPALAARVFSLADAERQTLQLVLASHDIAELAARLGLSPAGARKRVAALYRAIGVSGLAGLQAQTTRLLADEFVSDQQFDAGLQAVLALTPAQAAVARLVGDGHDLPGIAARLQLSPHTVRDHARAALESAAAPRLKDLAQLANEAAATHAIALGSDGLQHDRGGLLEATRIIRRGSRQIGIADFGPAGAQPIIICHGGMGTRRVAAELVTALQVHGLRPIGIDRPGFGLSDPAAADQFGTAADDMSHALDVLGLDQAIIAALDGGAPAAVSFWHRHGDRLLAGVLIKPHPPSTGRSGNRMIDRFARATMGGSDLATGLWRLVRERAGLAMTGRIVDLLFSGHPADAALLAQPDFRARMIAELLTFSNRSGLGIIAEQQEYRDWQVQPGGPARPWLIIVADGDPLWTPALADAGGASAWTALGDTRWQRIAGAGRFAHTTHAADIAAAVAAHWRDAIHPVGKVA